MTEGLEFSVAFVKNFKVNNAIKHKFQGQRDICFLCYKEKAEDSITFHCEHPFNKGANCNRDEDLPLRDLCDFCGESGKVFIKKKAKNN